MCANVHHSSPASCIVFVIFSYFGFGRRFGAYSGGILELRGVLYSVKAQEIANHVCLVQRTAKRVSGKGPRQKASQNIKKCQKYFRHFFDNFRAG